ncbi:MAG: biotin--[acetyl-CoA-carboxylase] ligase [Oscillospiraceae bacterium]|nr:biotin--[acetyl-CoA-carboxylase] ligase [Oscillospiraceae bacterium]
MSTKELLLEQLIRSENDYISGSRIARNLGISRNSIWKAVKSLQADGYVIDAVTNKGYRLTSSPDIIDEPSIRKYLDTKKIGMDIIILDETDSTNNYARNIAESGAGSGTVVIANKQTSGKGRMGRTFVSPVNSGIYMSIVLKSSVDIETAQLLTSCIAVAVSEALDSLYKCNSAIKWVNDIMVNDKKVCGILTEAAVNCETADFKYIIAGIGINVGTVRQTFDEQLLEIASSMEDETGIRNPRSRIIAEVLSRLECHLEKLKTKEFIEEYRRRSWIIGRKITVCTNMHEKNATAVDIDSSAGLLVEYEDGTQEIISSGEARVRRN